jgi:hypothetical protein
LEESRIITFARKGTITEQHMEIQLKAIQEEKDMIEEDIRKIKEYQRLQSQQTSIFDQTRKLFGDIIDNLDYMEGTSNDINAKQKQALIRLLVNRVLVDKEGVVTVEFAIKEPEKIPMTVSGTKNLQDSKTFFDYFTSPREESRRHTIRPGRGRADANRSPEHETRSSRIPFPAGSR